MGNQQPHDYLAARTPNDQLASGAPPRSEWYGVVGAPPPAPSDADTIDLGQLWGMVRDNAGMVFSIAGAVFVAVMALCLASHMSFQSSARIYLGESESKTTSGAGSNLEISAGSNETSSEIEVLRSRSMVRHAVLASGLNVTLAPPGWKQPRFWQWLLSGRNPALLDVAADRVNVSDSALDDDILKSRSYRLKFTDQQHYVLMAKGMRAVRGTLREQLRVPGLTLTLLPGRVEITPGVEFDMTVEPTEEVVERTLPALTVSTPKSTSTVEPARVLNLEFTSASRRGAASFLSHLMQGYLDARHAWKTEDASAAERFVTEQLRTMQQSLDRTQEKLADFRADNAAVVLGNEADAMRQQIGRYEEQRAAAMLQVSSLREIKRALRSPGEPLEAYMIGEAADDTVLRQLAQSLSNARERMSSLGGAYRENAPEVRQQQQQVNDQLATIRNYVDGRLTRAEKNVASLSAIIGSSESKLRAVPGAQLGLARIGRESEVYSKMYSYLLERQQQAAITKASTVSKNRILDVPQVPLREESPKLALHLASGVLGLLLGAAIVILRGLFSAVFRREHDVKGMLGSLQVFARVPLRLTRQRQKVADVGPNTPIFDVMAPQSDPAYAESFRSLRTNLYRALPGEHGKVVLVTSPMGSDGKTTCALSLAAMLAADNRRVLVIDADVRQPTHHTVLGLSKSPGLPDLVLQRPGAAKNAIRTLCLSVGWFDSLTSGEGSSAELLSASNFATFLVEARSRYDFVVLDSPSYPVVSDPLVLAPLSDFVLSVMRLGHTPRKLAEEHLAGMMSVARGYAVVVNNAISAVPGVSKTPPPSLSEAFRRT